MKSYDYKLNGYTYGYQFLGNFGVNNPSPNDLIDVPVEWTFSNAIGAKIARFAVPKGSKLQNIKVYTTSNSTGISVADMTSSDSMQGIGTVVDGDKIGLADNEYITKIEATIDKFPAYTNCSTGSSNSAGYGVYGLFTNGSAGTHTLTVNGITNTVTATPTTERKHAAKHITSLLTLKDSYYPGETISLSFEVTGNNNLYSRGNFVTDEFLQDPNVYIHVPKGFSLDETSLNFLFDSETITDKATLSSKYTDVSDGATIYKYTFTDPYTVMAGVQRKGNKQTTGYNSSSLLKIQFDLKIDASNQGYANLMLRDILMVEGKGNFQGWDGQEAAVRDDDFNLTGVAGKNLLAPIDTLKTSIVKLPELQVFSGIRVKGSTDDYYTYDGSETSIAGLSRTKKAEIEISYANNATNGFEKQIFISLYQNRVRTMGTTLTTKQFQTH